MPARKLKQYGMRPLFMCSEDGKTTFFWPYCEVCHLPFAFDDEAPFAYCNCGTAEWGYPRPAEWIPDPSAVQFKADSVDVATYTCTNCGGKGYTEVDDGYQMHHVKCSWCNGTKVLPNRRKHG